VVRTARPPKITNSFVFEWPGLFKPGFFVGWLISSCSAVGNGGAKRRKAMSRNLKVLLFVLALLVIGGSAYAFAATNTIEDSAAGYKASAVNGYSVTDIVYDLDATDPSLIDAIKFTITPTSGSAPAALVKLQTADGGSWTDCSLAAGAGASMNITCTYGSLSVDDLTALNIVASSSTDPAP